MSLGITALTVLGLAGTADAAATSRRDVCFPGACGSGTIAWGGPSPTGAGVKLSVRDTRCDKKKHTARIRIKAHGYSPASNKVYTYKGPWHYDKSCKGSKPVAWSNPVLPGRQRDHGHRHRDL
ncbi:hypothetical protein ACFQFC_00780 [Amorphoplanes digitatis]|uniref:Secreted protein n=1 Tax=Actinoplanes digitatis TaxID=1868 RepID=A0A7W7MQM6_9ACTN|nr:hypothetical protein [Actinoplanes digitatis]MBB4762710.1 hypothetical protein [Actinoplanes digitatis]